MGHMERMVELSLWVLGPAMGIAKVMVWEGCALALP